jgi:hypothetical protein
LIETYCRWLSNLSGWVLKEVGKMVLGTIITVQIDTKDERAA